MNTNAVLDVSSSSTGARWGGRAGSASPLTGAQGDAPSTGTAQKISAPGPVLSPSTRRARRSAARHQRLLRGRVRPDLRSGSSIKVETRSQRGNHALKSALFLSAFASLHDPTCRDYNDRKRAQGKRHNAALICLARRRVDVIFAMLRDRKPYQQPASGEPTPTAAAA